MVVTWGLRGVGVVRSRRGPHAYPTMGTASGCGTTREGCDGGGGCANVERVRSRRGPHAYPTMGTASGCGTTVWGFRLGGRKDGGRGVTAVGAALTSSGFVAEGVPTLTPPWVPHRGAVRRFGGSGLGGGKTREGCDGGGGRHVERVRSRRGPHAWTATMGTASGCGTTVWGFRLGGRKDGGRGVTAVGTALTSSGFVAEGVPTRALPWVPHRGAVRRFGGSGLGGGKTEGGV